MPDRTYQLAASLVCANMLELQKEMDSLKKGGIDFIHFDVMDGLFVPRYGLHPEMLAAVKSAAPAIPVDVHLMVENVEPYIPVFVKAGADYLVPHVESHRHLHRTIKMIKDAGAKAGVALNPATPLSVLDYVIEDVDLIMLMAINPGIVGHKLIPTMMQKISDLKKKIGDRDILLEIDGGVNPESAPLMVERGANLLVCGTSAIFRPQEAPLDQKISELRAIIDRHLDQKH